MSSTVCKATLILAAVACLIQVGEARRFGLKNRTPGLRNALRFPTQPHRPNIALLVPTSVAIPATNSTSNEAKNRPEQAVTGLLPLKAKLHTEFINFICGAKPATSTDPTTTMTTGKTTTTTRAANEANTEAPAEP